MHLFLLFSKRKYGFCLHHLSDMAVVMAIIYLPSDICMAPIHLLDFDAFNSIVHTHLEILSSLDFWSHVASWLFSGLLDLLILLPSRLLPLPCNSSLLISVKGRSVDDCSQGHSPAQSNANSMCVSPSTYLLKSTHKSQIPWKIDVILFATITTFSEC